MYRSSEYRLINVTGCFGFHSYMGENNSFLLNTIGLVITKQYFLFVNNWNIYMQKIYRQKWLFFSYIHFLQCPRGDIEGKKMYFFCTKLFIQVNVLPGQFGDMETITRAHYPIMTMRHKLFTSGTIRSHIG